MNKYKYRLVEQEEETPVGGGTTKDIVTYDLVLTPLSGTVADAIGALEKIENYGAYVSNLRNTKADIEKAVEDHFGPSQRFAKIKAEKERGKPFPMKTKAAIDAFIKTIAIKPKLLKWKVVGDTLVFPSAGNPTKKITEKIIDTVMSNAGIQYGLESKESITEEAKVRNAVKNLLK